MCWVAGQFARRGERGEGGVIHQPLCLPPPAAIHRGREVGRLQPQSINSRYAYCRYCRLLPFEMGGLLEGVGESIYTYSSTTHMCHYGCHYGCATCAVCCVLRRACCRGGNESRALSLSQGVQREDHTPRRSTVYALLSTLYSRAPFPRHHHPAVSYIQCGLQANPRRIPVERTPHFRTFVAHSGSE